MLTVTQVIRDHTKRKVFEQYETQRFVRTSEAIVSFHSEARDDEP